MRIVALFVLLPVLVFSNALDLWKSVTYHAYRLVVEISPKPKMRYEEVFRWRNAKFVRVLLPKKIEWYRDENGIWMGKSVLRKVPAKFFDLEDLALAELKRPTNVSIKRFKYGYLIEFETDKGDFEVILSEDGIPLKIVRKFSDIEIKMVYEKILGPPPPPKEVIGKIKLSDEKLFPDEIGKIISCFDWFYMEISDGVLILNGISEREWFRIEISRKRFDGAKKFGEFYIRAPFEFLRKIENESTPR